MRRFEKNQPVHIISRSLADIFREKDDCYRFIFQFFVANLGRRGTNVFAKDAVKAGEALLQGENIPQKFVIKEHPPLVDLIDFSLVVNHDHFYLSPNTEDAIPTLIRKLNNGFAKFFNITHGRKDAVFGSRYKSVVVENDRQSYAISRYISVINPLDVFQPGWRDEGLKDWKKAKEFLENYEFSSFLDRIGKRSAKILAPAEVLKQHSFGISPTGREEYRKFVEEFLKERQDKGFSSLSLE